MKKIHFLFFLSVLFAGAANGQAIPIVCNPFTQNIHFEPEPDSLGFPCGSAQTVAFTQGLTTSADAIEWQTAPLTVVICLTGFVFNGPASSVVSGTYAGNFDWTYDPFAPNCIFGTQNQTLPGTGSNPIFPNPLSSGTIKLSLLVPETSPRQTVLSVNVNLQVPGYMQNNSSPDDNESTQTQTYCELKISGTVYNDKTNDNNVNGTPISSPDATPLYANLIGPNDTVIAVTPIAPNGTYEFLNVTENTNYQVVLSMLQGVVGSAAPIADLPGTWVNTGEDCCDKLGNDGNPNGVIAVSVTNYSKVNVDYGIKDPTATGLPIVLKNFFVSEYNCGSLLSWTTSQEASTSHVEIYRKDVTQGSFRKIATVQSAGTSQVEKMYSYLDKEVNEDQAYEYQLKFVDIDAQFTTSEIKTLKLDCSKETSSINIFPNPATNELNILYVTEGDDISLEVEVMDITGRKLLAQSKVMTNGGTLMTLNITSLASGTYVLHYHDADGLSVGSIKFIKH